MRHVVNFGLLFSFLTLAVTGLMAFLLPFEIATTRVHLIFGLTTVLLVGLHLVSRIRYFRNQLPSSTQRKVGLPTLATLAGGWLALSVAAFQGWEPVRSLIEQGYETKHRTEIVRASALAGFEDPTNHRRIVARAAGDKADAGLSLLIKFGEPLESPPSIAVWTETPTGTMIETLYLDQRLAFSDKPRWGGIPTPRHHILPLWRHRYTMVSGIDPTGRVDAFTAATPTHSFTLDDYLQLGEGDAFILCVEVNAPHDPNARFPDEHVGQPSLLYTAYIELDAEPRYALLELTGHGGGAEKSGAIQYDLEGFTTAKGLIDLLLAKVEPVPRSPTTAPPVPQP